MSEDKFEYLSKLLNEIGSEIAEIVGGDPAGTFLYTEAGEGWIGSSLFKDEGSAVRYYDTTDRLDDLLLKFRNTEKRDMRWIVMEYEVKGTKVDAQFQYPEELDPDESEMERRPRALKKRYGDKPVIYPPWPGQPTE